MNNLNEKIREYEKEMEKMFLKNFINIVPAVKPVIENHKIERIYIGRELVLVDYGYVERNRLCFLNREGDILADIVFTSTIEEEIGDIWSQKEEIGDKILKILDQKNKKEFLEEFLQEILKNIETPIKDEDLWLYQRINTEIRYK